MNFRDLAWISLRFTAAWHQVWSCVRTVIMFSISAMSPSCFRIIVNKKGEMFVSYCLENPGFTFVNRSCIDADKLKISVRHKVLLFQPFFSSVTCFLQCCLMASSLLKYITSFQFVHTRAQHIVDWVTGQCCIHCLHFNSHVFHGNCRRVSSCSVPCQAEGMHFIIKFCMLPRIW
jgi:hypothetical protein